MIRRAPSGPGVARPPCRASSRQLPEGWRVCEHPCMMFGGLHAGSWDILIIPVVMMLLFAVILVRMYHGGHR